MGALTALYHIIISTTIIIRPHAHAQRDMYALTLCKLKLKRHANVSTCSKSASTHAGTGCTTKVNARMKHVL